MVNAFHFFHVSADICIFITDVFLGKAGYQLKQTEGYSSANWILLDYGDIVIHLFDEENRLFYDLERIWRDGKVMDAKELKEEQ